ncbi:MAG: DUF4835 family protein [Saprospiraceae bacterium]|jgi:hypothetical protein|nr:DUF4835 family protein [Saprospiraceae bacterium]MBK8825146.1 DUF4835 family protein [Saprospiraceae bacterium]MBK8885596.1 DUF4835 family protein [Saprospiraceae bacterium]MBK9580934.1 DUF4835 family protein [Saprospiraceae bacterium]MBK9742467.1 DUF4835 family protein [Saprospiraceae bacterium]
MYKLLLGLVFVLLSITLGTSQELNFRVSVQTLSSINSVNLDPSYFKGMEKKMSELLNTTKWTNDEYLEHEKIRGSFVMTITELSQGSAIKAEIILQTERPVFNSTYSSPMINLIDKNVSFIYNELLPLNKTANTFYDNLSAILSYYAYVSLGMDYDSFSVNGGEPFLLKAQEIVTSLPSNVVNDEGWRNDGGGRRNRYWLLENLLSPRMRQFRQAFYEYHRLSLDNMYSEQDKSRFVMLSALTSMGQANLEYSGTYLVQVFGDAKKDEIIEIFKNGDPGQKSKIKTIMTGLDPTKASKYNEALN